MIYSLSLTELTVLLEVAKAHDPLHHLLFLLAFRHGLRVSEVSTLTPKNIIGKFLKVQRLKQSCLTTQPLVHRDDPLFDELMPLMTRLLMLKGDLGAPIFPGPRGGFISRFQVRRLIKRYGREANIPEHKLHPHILKSTCGTMGIKQLRIDELRCWMGHKSLASTGYYLGVSEEEVAASVQKMTI